MWPIESCHFQWPWMKVIHLLRGFSNAGHQTSAQQFTRFELARARDSLSAIVELLVVDIILFIKHSRILFKFYGKINKTLQDSNVRRMLSHTILNMVRHDICRHNYAVERGLVVGFCGQPHYCNRPYYPTARFRSPSSYMVSVEPFPDGLRSMSCKFAQMGPRPITFLRLWPATDPEPHCRHVPTDKIWRRTESTPRSRWWRSHMAGSHSDCSTREMKWILIYH